MLVAKLGDMITENEMATRSSTWKYFSNEMATEVCLVDAQAKLMESEGLKVGSLTFKRWISYISHIDDEV